MLRDGFQSCAYVWKQLRPYALLPWLQIVRLQSWKLREQLLRFAVSGLLEELFSLRLGTSPVSGYADVLKHVTVAWISKSPVYKPEEKAVVKGGMFCMNIVPGLTA